MAQTVRICLQSRRPRFNPWVKNIPWRRKWQPTPVCLSGESHGQRSLVVYSAWGCKELDTTEWLTLSLAQRRGSSAWWQWIHSVWHHRSNFKTRTSVLHSAVSEHTYNTGIKICTYSNIRSVTLRRVREREDGRRTFESWALFTTFHFWKQKKQLKQIRQTPILFLNWVSYTVSCNFLYVWSNSWLKFKF